MRISVKDGSFSKFVGENAKIVETLKLKELDRFHLVMNAVKRLGRHENIISSMKKNLEEHKKYISEVGDDPPEIRDWKWTRS